MHTTAGFPDVLDIRFEEITSGEFAQGEDMVPRFYTVKTPDQATMRGSGLTPLPLAEEFQGQIPYIQASQGYDWESTYKIFAAGVQVERELYDYSQFDVIENLWKSLPKSFQKKRQIDAARFFNNIFSVDTYFHSHTEGVAPCSNSHTTTTGESTASGFDNLVTTAFSPTALKAACLQFRKFKDAQAQPIDGHSPTHILIPVDLQDRVEEVLKTSKSLDTAEGNINVLENRVQMVPWIRFTDVNNWILYNQSMLKDTLYWYQSLEPEFARIEDFDTVVAKYRGYERRHTAYTDWRAFLGAQVS